MNALKAVTSDVTITVNFRNNSLIDQLEKI